MLGPQPVEERHAVHAGHDYIGEEQIDIRRELIPQLIKAGAEGIIEYPLNKVI